MSIYSVALHLFLAIAKLVPVLEEFRRGVKTNFVPSFVVCESERDSKSRSLFVCLFVRSFEWL